MRLLRFALSALHLFLLLLLLATSLNAVVPPHVFPYLNLLSLAFPVLMIANILLCLWWILRLKKRALLFVGISLLLIKPVGRWINWHSPAETKANLKVVSMNIKGGVMGHDALESYFVEKNADILLLQETGESFQAPGYKYVNDSYPILAVNTKLPILKTEKIATTGNGNSMYADIDVRGTTIRVINVYLNPFSFDKQKVKPGDNLQANKTKVIYILRRLVPTFKIHEQEILDIRKAIDASPYPVLLAGDLNAVPNSYEYYQLSGALTDAFVETGRGSATSFHDYKFPIRIDYIFSSSEIKPVRYRVDRSVELSDHYPVIAEFKIN